MFVDLFDQIDELCHTIIHSELFVQYVECKNKLQQDAEAQALINKFVDLKEKFSEVERFGKYHPDYETVNKEMREMKRTLDFHPTIADFKKAERNLDKLLYEISTIIAHSVSPSIKVPTGNPFIDERSCNGGCSTGGGCSCS